MKRAVLFFAVISIGVLAAGLALASTQRGAAHAARVGKANKVTICHATGNGGWVEITPSVNGVLNGHAGHPNDIIPPFTYGNPPQTFPGLNWDSEGQAIYENGCVDPTPPQEPIGIVATCVDVHGGTFDATFGYDSANASEVTIPIGPNNTVSPAPPDRGQPTLFEPGTVSKAFTVTGIPIGTALTWSLTYAGATATATATSSTEPACSTPPPEPERIGVFVKCVTNHGSTYDATFGYQNDNDAAVTIPVGSRNRFFPAPRDRGQTTTFRPGNVQRAFIVRGIPRKRVIAWVVRQSGIRVAVASARVASKCRRPPNPVSPIGVFVTCVSNHGATYDAVFGYENPNTVDATVPVSLSNMFMPTPADRGQPTVFVPGRTTEAVTVKGIPKDVVLTWRVAFHGTTTASARASFPEACGGPEPPEPPEPTPPEPTPPGPPPRAFGIFATCVTNSGPTFRATFGYANLNHDDLIVPVGASNVVEPARGNGRQPTTFRPGTVLTAFTVRAVPANRSATWRVTIAPGVVRTATASASTTRKCPLAPPTAPDLITTKTVGPRTVAVGGRFTSTITVRNTGSGAAFRVRIVDVRLDRRSEVISAAATRGSCSVQRGPDRGVCVVAILPPGSTVMMRTAWRAMSPGAAKDLAIAATAGRRDGNRRNNLAVAGVRVRVSAGQGARPNYTG